MIFLGYFISYIIRYNLSVHVVDMTQMSKREQVKHNFTIYLRGNYTRHNVRSRAEVSFLYKYLRYNDISPLRTPKLKHVSV